MKDNGTEITPQIKHIPIDKIDEEMVPQKTAKKDKSYIWKKPWLVKRKDKKANEKQSQNVIQYKMEDAENFSKRKDTPPSKKKRNKK